MLHKNIHHAKTITNLVNQGKSSQAITIFSQLQKTGYLITEFILSATLRACARASAITEGKQLHCLITKNGHDHDVVLMTSLIDMYSKCDRLKEARHVFYEMPERNVDVIARNIMVSALCWSSSTREAIKLFDTMPERNVDSWNSLISGLGQSSKGREGLSFFERMRSEGVEPDGLTMVIVLSICADLAALVDGKQAHALAIQHGHELYLPVGNAIMSMYSKCGSMADSLSCFNSMPMKNVVSWTTLIEGYGKQGRGLEAIKVFDSMESQGVMPNNVTFLGALYACSHSGLVEEGFTIFNTMVYKYSITPNMEHYTSMVDLLARAGRVKEAWGFVEAMPMKPDTKLLTALLSSCWWHRDDMDTARVVGERAIELEPEEAGVYVLVAKLYGLVGDLEGANKVKRLMSNRGLTKETACTWIEISQRS